MKFVASNNIVKHIEKNLQSRMYHVTKFYDWLAVNEDTPIKVKLQVLDTCLFSAYLYGVETWYEIDKVSEQITLLERKLLRCILCVKNNTPNDLLYIELNRQDIIASIKFRQYNFFKRLLSLEIDESISKKIVSLHRQLPLCRYYDNIDINAIKNNKSDLKIVCSYHVLIEIS